MALIKTKSFKIAIYAQGDENSSKLALILPGRLDSKDYVHMHSHVEYLANRGYYALSFDPPGSWDSPGGIKIYSTSNYLKAVEEIIKFYGNKPTLLWGHSRGGTVAMLASSDSAVIGIIIIMATYGAPTAPKPESLLSGIQVEYRDFPPGAHRTAEQKKFNLPISYFKDGEQYNPVAALKKCSKPKLLVYGTQDKFTAPDIVKKVFDNIPEPKMLHELATNHDYRYHLDSIKEVNAVTDQFLNRFITR